MKRLVVLFLILAMMGCSSKEDRRDSLIANAKRLEAEDKCAEARVEARNAIKLDPQSAEAYLVLGRCAMKEQNWRNAYNAFSQVVQIDPDNLEGVENLARLYLLSGNIDQAQNLVDQLTAADPNALSYRVIQSGIRLRQKQIPQAIAILQDVLREAPYNEEATIGLATAFMENGQLEEAKSLIRDAIAHNDKSALFVNYMVNIAILQKDYDEALEQLTRLRAFQPENENILLRIIDMYLLTGRTEEAVDILQDEVAKGPTKANLRSRLAELKYNAGENEEGITIIDKAPTMTSKLLLTRSVGLLRLQKTDEAIAELKKVSADPDAGNDALVARQRLAEIYVISNQTDEAFKELNEILDRNPGDIKALALRGRLYYLRGQYNDAIADLRAALRENPNDSPSYLALAESHRMTGNQRLAEDTLRDAIRITPNYAPAYLILARMQRIQDNMNGALETLRTGASTTDLPDLHFAYVDTLVMNKQYGQAQTYLTRLVANPNLAYQGNMRLAALNAEQRKFIEARNYYANALELHPNSGQAAEGYVLMEVGAGRATQAEAWAEERAAARPEDPSSMALLAEVYNENGKYNEAVDYFKRAANYAPQWDQPYVRLMQIYNVSLNRPEEGIAFLSAKWDENPEVITPAAILASFYESRKDYEDAEKIYRQLLAKNPDLIAVNNNLAYIITLHNPTPQRLDEALNMARKAAASNTPETQDTLGWVYYQRGQLPEALENLTKAYESAGEKTPIIGFHLAVVHNALGNKEEARTVISDVLERFQHFDNREEAEALLKQL